jgi:hypothetical protein
MPVSTKPPQPRTGYAHPGCYARVLEDCDQKLSREHFISKKLLDRLTPLTVEGASWAIERRPITSKALAAKVLCTRHNNALSGLDDKITDFYDAMMLWHRGERVGDCTFEGEDLERWAIKAMLGFMTSGNARGPGGGQMIARSVPEGYVRVLFGDEELREGCGLYLIDQWIPPGRPPAGVSLTIVTAEGGNDRDVAGIAASIANIPFVVTVAAATRTLQGYRPREIQLVGSGRLVLSWPTSYRGGGVFILERD